MRGERPLATEQRNRAAGNGSIVGPPARGGPGSDAARASVARRELLDSLRGSLVVLLWASGLAWLLLLAFSRWGTSPRPWPIELLDTFALYAFAPLLALVPAALLLRSRALAALALAVGLFFLLQFGSRLVPKPAVASPSDAGLRVLTYNVYGRNDDAAPLAELIRSVAPYVVLLQEVRRGYAADLIRRIGSDYPFRILAATETSNDGSGTFSRLPIIDAQAFQLGEHSNAFQHLRLGVGEREIALFNVHLASPDVRAREVRGRVPLVRAFDSRRRDLELDWLIAETERLSIPFVLAGDFNTSDGSRPYRAFSGRWRDAFGERGWGFGHTFPARRTPWSVPFPIRFPLIRIDYILSSQELAPSRAWVPRLAGSDHFPVVAELYLTGR